MNTLMGNQFMFELPGRSNQSLVYWRRGKSGDRPLLLLHGLGDCAAVWAGVATELTNSSDDSGYDIVVPDLPGHGDSGKGDRPYSTEAIIQDLEALLDHLGWSSAVIVGHSWTGKVVARWMQQSPQRFDRAVIIDPFFISKMPDWLRLSFPVLYRVLPFLKLSGPFGDRAAAETCARGLKQYRGWNPWQAAAFAANIEQKSDGTWGSKLDLLARDRVFEDVLCVAGFTQPVSTPTLLLLPDRGLNQFEWQTQDFHRFCAALTVQSLPGNHWPFLSHPIEVAQALQHWLGLPIQNPENAEQ